MFFQAQPPMYDPEDVRPMREELVAVGIKELRSVEDVDRALGTRKGTQLVVVNSVCGCAAGGARPGVALALQNDLIPDELYTVFAGVDREATARVRQLIVGYPPSSPSVALFKDGQVVFMLERNMVEGHSPEQIAAALADQFARHCSRRGPSVTPEVFGSLDFVKMCGSALAAKAAARR